MAFIELTDFPSSIHADILDGLTRGNDTVITENAERSIDQVQGYLNGRYDCNAIFSATGIARNKFIMRLTLSITIYYIFLIHNPRKMTQLVIDEKESALETLGKIQAGKINPVGLPEPVKVIDDTPNSGDGNSLQWGGDLQMQTNW